MIKIGIFDSGHGGLSILKKLSQFTHSLDVFYFADSNHHPYGNRQPSYIKERSRVIVSLLLERGVETIIIACNTATAVAIDELRLEFPKCQIIGVEPYLNYINQNETQRILALVTQATFDSKRFIDLRERRDPLFKINCIAANGLAEVIENGILQLSSKETMAIEVKSKLQKIPKEDYDCIILGCTHYPLAKELIESYFECISICPSLGVVKHLAKLLNIELVSSTDKESNTFYYASSPTNIWTMRQLKEFLVW